MARELEGKVTIVTGAGAGIGRATALLCAKEGARLVLADEARRRLFGQIYPAKRISGRCWTTP